MSKLKIFLDCIFEFLKTNLSIVVLVQTIKHSPQYLLILFYLAPNSFMQLLKSYKSILINIDEIKCLLEWFINVRFL